MNPSIVEKLSKLVNRDSVYRSYAQTVLYAARIISCQEYMSRLKTCSIVSTRELSKFRIWFTGSYSALTTKLCALALLSCELRQMETVAARCLEEGLSKKDLSYIMAMRRNPHLVSMFRTLKQEKFEGRCPRPSAVRRECEAMLLSKQSYANQLVARKLRFVTMFNKLTQEDLVADVLSRCVQQFYWSYCIRDSSYTVKLMSAVANNHVRNMAYYYSARQRAQATLPDKHGISHSTVVSNVVRTADGETNLFEQLESKPSTTEDQIDASNIIKRFATSRKKRTILAALSGLHLQEFDKWLCTNKKIKQGQTYAEVLTLPAIIRLIARFLAVRTSSVKAFIKQIRRYAKHGLDGNLQPANG